MRRTAVVVTASVLTALGAGAILAVSGGAQAPGGRTLSYVTKNCSFKVVDAPPKAKSERSPPGAGDAFLLSCQITTPEGASAGRLDARCDITRGGRNLRGICKGAYDLADGDMYLMARLTSSNTTTGVVVGGDGAYTGARGTFISKDRPGEAGGDPSDETITLLP